MAWCAGLADASGEAVLVDGRVVATFDAIVAAHPTEAGVACAGSRGGRVVVRDVDGAEVASVERVVSLGPDHDDAYFERVDGATWFVSQEAKRQRLHVGAWRSPPADVIVPLCLSSRGEPVYGAREGKAWSLRMGASTQPLRRRPVAAWRPDRDVDAADAVNGEVFVVALSDGTSTTVSRPVA